MLLQCFVIVSCIAMLVFLFVERFWNHDPTLQDPAAMVVICTMFLLLIAAACLLKQEEEQDM
jgi:hypothetical protein